MVELRSVQHAIEQGLEHLAHASSGRDGEDAHDVLPVDGQVGDPQGGVVGRYLGDARAQLAGLGLAVLTLSPAGDVGLAQGEEQRHQIPADPLHEAANRAVGPVARVEEHMTANQSGRRCRVPRRTA